MTIRNKIWRPQPPASIRVRKPTASADHPQTKLSNLVDVVDVGDVIDVVYVLDVVDVVDVKLIVYTYMVGNNFRTSNNGRCGRRLPNS